MLQVSRWTPFASVLLVSLICGGVVANNSAMMWMGGNTAASPSGVVSLPARILLSVILVSTIVRMKWTTAHHDAHLIPSQMFALLPSRLIRWASLRDTLCRNTRSASRNGPHARYPSKRGCRTRHWRWSWPRAWAPTLSRTCRVR